MNLRKTKDCKIFCFFCLHTTRLLKANIYVYRIYVFFSGNIWIVQKFHYKKTVKQIVTEFESKSCFWKCCFGLKIFWSKSFKLLCNHYTQSQIFKNNSIYPVLKYNYIVSSTCNAHLKKLRANSSPEVFMVWETIMTRAHETMKPDPWIT